MELTLSYAKEHLNLPDDFHDDDNYITELIGVVTAYTTTYLDLTNSEDSQKVMQMPQVVHAMVMMLGTLYNNRESEVYGNTQEMKVFQRLLGQFKYLSV